MWTVEHRPNWDRIGRRGEVVPEDKHFGFITQRDGSDVFFHNSGIEGDPEQVMQENAPVWYEVITTERGPQAINVHLRE